MSEILILYCVFSYLFIIGLVIEAFRDSSTTTSMKINGVIFIICSPISFPIILGVRSL